MPPSLASPLRFLRISLVIIGLLQLAGFASGAAGIDAANRQRVDQTPVQLFLADHATPLAILGHQLTTLGSGKPPPVTLPFAPAPETSPIPAPVLARGSRAIGYGEALFGAWIWDKPPARSPPLA